MVPIKAQRRANVAFLLIAHQLNHFLFLTFLDMGVLFDICPLTFVICPLTFNILFDLIDVFLLETSCRILDLR